MDCTGRDKDMYSMSLRPATAACTFSMSSALQRARPQMIGPKFSSAMALTDSKSPGEAAGKPASMMSTLSSARSLATRSFSRSVMLQPGACSPSRSVVSNIRTWSLIVYSSSQSMRLRRSAPTFSIGCSRSAFIMRLNSGMPASFSAIQLRAKVPS